MDHNGYVVNVTDFHFSNPRFFPGSLKYSLLFNFDIVNLLLKHNGGRGRRPNVVIFVVWKTLIVGGWVGVAWGTKFYLGLAEISS